MMSRAFVFVLVLLCGAGFAVALGGDRALLQAKKVIVIQKAAPAPAPAPTPAPTPKPTLHPLQHQLRWSGSALASRS
eukprot:jgi/Chrzof1/7848/Cz02g38220.t1